MLNKLSYLEKFLNFVDLIQRIRYNVCVTNKKEIHFTFLKVLLMVNKIFHLVDTNIDFLLHKFCVCIHSLSTPKWWKIFNHFKQHKLSNLTNFYSDLFQLKIYASLTGRFRNPNARKNSL